MKVTKLQGRRLDGKRVWCSNKGKKGGAHPRLPFVLVNEKFYCCDCYNKLAALLNLPAIAPYKRRHSRTFSRDKWKEKTCTERILNLRRRATAAELVFSRKLRRVVCATIKFQRAFIKGQGYAIVDFYVPSRKLAIEIDGGYHNTPEQQKKDRWKESYLATRGVRVVRFTNDEAMSMTPQQIKERIEQ